MRSGWGIGGRRRSIALTRLKTAVLTPMPSVSDSSATTVNPGRLRARRNARRMSLINECTRDLRRKRGARFTVRPRRGGGFSRRRSTSLYRMPVRIVVPDDFPPVLTGTTAERRLRELGEVRIHSERGADREDELIRRVKEANVVLNIRAHARFNARVIAACDQLRCISVWGTGTDHIDFAAARARGITVSSTPGVNAHAVAEHAIALMLAIARKIPAMDSGVRAGHWPRAMLVQLEGKTLGVVGLGAIGRRVATLASAFGMRVLATTFGDDAGRAAQVGAQHVPLDTLLRESDFVSLHLRLSERTTSYLSQRHLA